ncbi:Ku protein [Streptomyces aurantiogriseus]|uniref:Ku domain-containing protein n=1 Tax=Streptomyces aurantiogriseus TaxID=66870 RepID=A0A918F5E9_9ACTN|nr:Ku protein [Streptomyces aurantiogriseus]GGR09563.1 hypothetical protein GCM10010251_26690 [Streptomyces aurantiogriseus]
MRVLWSGHITCELVNVPVRLYAAMQETRPQLHEVHVTDSARIRHRRVCEADDREVGEGEIGRGRQTPYGRMVVLRDEDLDRLPLATRRRVEILGFVDDHDVDPLLYDRAYYADPDGEPGQRPCALLVEALARTGRVGVAIGDDTQRINLTFSLRPEPGRAAVAPAGAGRLFEGTPTLPDVASYYRHTCPRRLVVTGAPGAGKSVLALELMLALIEEREEGDPVPVRLSLAEWDTATAIPQSAWLARHLVDVYDWPAKMAGELIRQRRVLPVLDVLDRHPTGTLATALSTPWRLTLAATVYAQHGDPCGLARHATASDLDEHLLARFIPAATALHPRARRLYAVGDVHCWLARLADYLDTPSPAPGAPAGAGIRAHTDLVLHQLWPMAGSKRVRAADAVLTALAVLLPIPLGWATAIPGVMIMSIVAAVVVGCHAARASVDPPARVRWGRLRTKAGCRDLAVWLALGILSGLAVGLLVGLAAGLGLGLVVGLMVGVGFGAPSGRRYLVLVLCSRGKLPWRLGVFLDWACAAGRLRFSGSAYQFRHRELQQWLARHPGHPPV